MDALRYIADPADIMDGEPWDADDSGDELDEEQSARSPGEARAQRGPGSAVAADAEETGAHVSDEDCEVCGSFLDEFEQGLKLCDFCAHEQAHCDDFEERGDR